MRSSLSLADWAKNNRLDQSRRSSSEPLQPPIQENRLRRLHQSFPDSRRQHQIIPRFRSFKDDLPQSHDLPPPLQATFIYICRDEARRRRRRGSGEPALHLGYGPPHPSPARPRTPDCSEPPRSSRRDAADNSSATGARVEVECLLRVDLSLSFSRGRC